MHISLVAIQIVLVILWYTVMPTVSAWIIFIPALLFGALLLWAIVLMLIAVAFAVSVTR